MHCFIKSYFFIFSFFAKNIITIFFSCSYLSHTKLADALNSIRISFLWRAIGIYSNHVLSMTKVDIPFVRPALDPGLSRPDIGRPAIKAGRSLKRNQSVSLWLRPMAQPLVHTPPAVPPRLEGSLSLDFLTLKKIRPIKC